MTRTLTGIDQDENPLVGIAPYKTITTDGSGNANGVGPGTSGQVLTSNGAAAYPSYQAPTTSYTNLTVTNNLTLSAILNKYLLTDGAGLVIGSTTIPTSALTGTLGVANGGTGQTSFTNGALTSTSNNVSGGTLSVGYGGTGNTTLSSGQYLKGNGTSAITSSATIPTSDLSGTVSLTTQVSGTLPVSNGGTGLTSTSQNFVFSGPTSGSGAPTWKALTIPAVPFEIYTFTDEKSSGTSGGTFTSGAWRTRTLNTNYVFPSGATRITRSSNVLSVGAGTYLVTAQGQCRKGDSHQLRIQNTSDATTPLLGITAYAYSPAEVNDTAVLTGVLTLAATKNIELQHRCGTTQSTNGFGVASSWGTEVYASITLQYIG